MADKLHSDTQPKIESLYYAPGSQSSGDLTGDITVTATSKPAAPDYTISLTLPAPADGRLEVKRTAFVFRADITSYNGGATALNFAINVNGVERLTGNFTATGYQYAAQNLAEGQFGLGGATSFDIFLWVDAGNVVFHGRRIDFAIGAKDTTLDTSPAIVLRHQGAVSLGGVFSRTPAGTGTLRLRATTPAGVSTANPVYEKSNSDWAYFSVPEALVDSPGITMHISDARYIAYLSRILAVLRSEQ